MKSIADLNREFRNLPEYDLYKSITGFDISLYIFNKNYAEICKLMQFFCDDSKSQMLLAVRSRDKLNVFLDEIIRTLHNFVAAAMSLVDHTRNFYQKLYDANGKFPDYQLRIDADFKDDPLIQFVHCLRQYCQHYRAPNISVVESLGQEDDRPKRAIKLLKDDLSAFSEWNAKAKEYLTQAEEKIDLPYVLNSYQNKVLKFHSWFRGRQKEIHAKELAFLKDKEQEVLLAQLNMFLKMSLSENEKAQPSEEEIFYGIFNSEDYEQLAVLPQASEQRAKRAIEILKKHITPPRDTVDKILLWYKKNTSRGS